MKRGFWCGLFFVGFCGVLLFLFCLFLFGLENEGKIKLIEMVLFFLWCFTFGKQIYIKISIKDGK